MKQQQLIGYRPNYPRKAMQSAALTAAALMAMGAVGCKKPVVLEPVQTEGMISIVEPTEEPELQGKITVTEPPEEVLVTDGEVAIPEPTEEELVLSGEEYIPECTPEVPLQTTGVLFVPTATPQA